MTRSVMIPGQIFRRDGSDPSWNAYVIILDNKVGAPFNSRDNDGLKCYIVYVANPAICGLILNSTYHETLTFMFWTHSLV